MKIIWTPEARQDRIDIWDHIAAENPPAAVWMDELFNDAVTRLANYPMLGQPGKIPGTRELVPHESYRLVYELTAKRYGYWPLFIRLDSGRQYASRSEIISIRAKYLFYEQAIKRDFRQGT